MPPKLLTAPAAALPATFIGREKELSDIRNLLTRQNTLALVNAEGGMGKTTLAARYWQQFENQYQHLAWLFCENGILTAMRDQLPYALGLIEELNQFADKPDQQALVIKTAMANLPKDCLLVLDNANDEAHIRGFQQVMTGLGWHVLITSRCSKVLPDSEYKITGLPPKQAKELFKKYHDEKTPEFEALLERFLPAVDYNTLCIEVFSKNLREGTAWGLSLAALLEKLEKNRLFLGEHSFEIHTEWANSVQKETIKSTDQVIEALYDVADLQQRHPELHDLLCTFALLPAENHPPTVLGELLAPDEKSRLKRAIDQLAQKGWLSTDRSTYRISPVVQKILLQRNVERRWELGEPIVQRLQSVFETEGYHSKNIATAGPFADLVFGLAENLEAANEDLSILFDRLWVYHTATGNFAMAIYAAHKQREINEKSGNKNRLAISYSRLGETHISLGNLPQALTFFKDETKLFKELLEAYPQNVDFKNGLAISYSRLGDTNILLGNLPQALTFFEQYNDLVKELQIAYPQNVSFKNLMAFSCQFLGNTHRILGDLLQALTFFEQYNKLIKELQIAFPQNVSFKNSLAISCQFLGDTHSSLGNLPQALTFFENMSTLFEELHETYPQNVDFKNGLAVSYEKLGSTYSALDNLPQALTFFEKYNTLEKELHEAYPQNVDFKLNLGSANQFLGITHTSIGNLEIASTFFENMSKLFEELHVAYPQNVSFKYGLAVSYLKRGEIYSLLGNLTQALPFFENMPKLFEELHETYPQNVDFKNGLAICYSKVGLFYMYQKKDKVKARFFFTKYLVLWEELARDFPSFAKFQSGLQKVNIALESLDKQKSFMKRIHEYFEWAKKVPKA